MDVALAFEMQDQEKSSRYVLHSQKWYLPNTSNRCFNIRVGVGGGGVYKVKVRVNVTCYIRAGFDMKHHQQESNH